MESSPTIFLSLAAGDAKLFCENCSTMDGSDGIVITILNEWNLRNKGVLRMDMREEPNDVISS
jgi:hypothetical protein